MVAWPIWEPFPAFKVADSLKNHANKDTKMTDSPGTFPELVRKVRRQLGISQEELAHRLGVSFATINRWENGKTTPFKLARAQFDAFCEKMVATGKLRLEETESDQRRAQEGRKASRAPG